MAVGSDGSNGAAKKKKEQQQQQQPKRSEAVIRNEFITLAAQKDTHGSLMHNNPLLSPLYPTTASERAPVHAAVFAIFFL